MIICIVHSLQGIEHKNDTWKQYLTILTSSKGQAFTDI